MTRLEETMAALKRLKRGLYGASPSKLSHRIADAVIIERYIDHITEVGMPAFVPMGQQVYKVIKEVADDFLISSGEESKRAFAKELLELMGGE